MATHDYTHLCKFADHDLPDGLLDAILKDHTSCAGVAIPGGGDEYLWTFLQAEGTNTKDVQELLANYKDKACVLSFCKGPTPFPQDDVQPFVALFDSEGNTTMSCCISGKSFASRAKGGDEAPERQIYNKLVLPQILKAAKLQEDDAEATWQDMATDESLKDVMDMIAGDGGIITIVTNSGIHSWGEGITDYEFGWCTDPCGWTAEVKKPEPKKAGISGFGKRPEGLKPEPKTATSQVSLPDTKVEEATASDDGVENVDWAWWAPPSAWTKDQKRKAYAEADRLDGTKGIVPQGYKDCPKIKVRLKKVVKSLQDIPKPVQPEVVSSNTVTDEALPVISPKSKAYIQNRFVKNGHVQATISEGKKIIDPKRIAKLCNEEWASYIEAGGIDDLRECMYYTDAERSDLVRNAPDAAIVLLKDLSYLAYNLLKETNKLEIKIAAPAETEKDKHVEAKEILKPVKAAVSGFGKRR
jgi:hypothetical protein